MYLDQVANFIVTNSANKQPASTTSAPTPTGYVDPFTGGSRYIPGGGTQTGSAGGNADPFTGGSSYTTSNPAPPRPVNNGSGGANADPFTGSSSYTTLQGSDYKKPQYVPQQTYLRFDQGNLAAIHNKLKEFNSRVGDSNHTMDESHLNAVIKLADEESVKDTAAVITLIKMLEWPDGKLKISD